MLEIGRIKKKENNRRRKQEKSSFISIGRGREKKRPI
jgi:hypothetical protein